MRRKLSKGALIMIVLVLIVLAGNQLIIGLFSRFSEKLILENHELYVLQELKGSLGKILIEESQYLITEEDILASVKNAERKLEDCQRELSSVHKGEAWVRVESMFNDVEKNVSTLVNSPPVNGVLQHVISHQIMDLIIEVEALIEETVHEIDEYEVRSHKVKVHGTITVVVLGGFLIVLLLIWSFRFIRELTRPIDQLLSTTKKIGEGNRDLRVSVDDSQDEFKQLADSFNGMLDVLVKTSLSEKFLYKILNNLYGALMVTDAEANIRTINTTTCRMLKHMRVDIIGKDILTFFGSGADVSDKADIEALTLRELSVFVSEKTTMLDKDGREIPVYVTSVILENNEGNPEGMVVVGHDLTVEKENEEKIEKLRKERMIAINEAQELERLRISRDLHDGLGQLLTGISYAVQKIDEDGVVEHEFSERLQIQVNTAIQEAKDIAYNLTPLVLKDFGLPAAIENLIQRTNLLQKTQFIFNSYSFGERIDEKLEKALFRICQEAVNNIIKHSGASSSTIELYRVEDMIVLVVEDDGKGFDTGFLNQKEEVKGLGLIGMQERVDAFDGDLSINSTSETGTEILIEIPCRRRKHKNGNS